MRTIIIGLCTLIITLMVQNFYVQQELEAVLTGRKYDYKIMEKFSDQLYHMYQNEQ